jgi:hypothetical protein
MEANSHPLIKREFPVQRLCHQMCAFMAIRHPAAHYDAPPGVISNQVYSRHCFRTVLAVKAFSFLGLVHTGRFTVGTHVDKAVLYRIYISCI